MINAEIQKISNIVLLQLIIKEEVLEYLTELEENRENRPFLDKIL